MVYLLIVSLIWAFSFGLIKTNLTGLDANLVSFIRLFISLLVFIPFVRIKSIPQKARFKLVAIGGVQYGLMYLFYINSYQYLQSYEIALFTIFTPLYIIFINDLLQKKISKVFLFTSALAVIGAAIINYRSIDSSDFIYGFLLVQASNLCFAAGQIFYTRIKKELAQQSNVSLFGFMYAGAVVVSFSASLFTTHYSSIQFSSEQVWTLIYLGAVASGLSFFLWNVGATKVNEGALAVFNNLKIPLAIVTSILIFGESTDITKLLIGGSLILAALLINEKITGRELT